MTAALALAAIPAAPSAILLEPDRVFDGTTVHDGWVVLVRGDRIAAVGPAAQSRRATTSSRAG